MTWFIVNAKALKCTIYPTGAVNFSSIVSQARAFDAIRDCTGPMIKTLIYDNISKPKYGSFKQALFGHLDSAILGDSSSVAVKRCWYSDPDTGARLIYDKHTQVSKLSGEINCLRWASALMGLVYDYINDYTMTHGPVPFTIPSMRFVRSALAIAEDTDDVFLLEEFIDDSVDGRFIKYIGNGSAKPYDLFDGDAVHRGEFLSFSQHLQYLNTGEHAFVSDFQGKSVRQANVVYSPDAFSSRWTSFFDGSSTYNFTAGHNSFPLFT
jgi:hypothetical protein